MCISVDDFTVRYDHTSPSGGASPDWFSSSEAAQGGKLEGDEEEEGGKRGDSPPGVTELGNVGVPSCFFCFLKIVYRFKSQIH